ncbi:MAG TPA: flagellar hook-associated protein FlgL [Candidatus Hydrogenedentes bacterium]|jgi:flagellar hook-associated protein 3 FlgL|nr:flagellar hook-associated protein FlgL [Candidatus Hydrogenedentota bacterium]HPJ99420.1 flagellar hook-associated protein FlgL [Candidatus Hydrogenedentota bacterium]
MGAMRVTTQLLVDRSIRNINNQSNRLLTLQEQLATGLRVNRPSDDPIDARRAVSIRALLGKNEQYLANISMVSSPVAETNTSIETILSSFNRAWELALRGANGTNAQNQLDALALEINQLLEGIFSTANHETNGRYLFGGTRTTTPPYEATRNAEGEITAVHFAGNAEAIHVAISDVLDLQYNEIGLDVFSKNQDIFQTLLAVRDNLRAGDTSALGAVRLDEMETVRDQLTSALARVGSIQNRLDRSSEELEQFAFQLQTQLSDAIDADYADVITRLQAQTNAFQAALSAAARAIMPSLLDYVR